MNDRIAPQADVVLATLNARWSHCAFGLRCLRAALGPHRARSVIWEGTLEHRPADVVERLLAHRPRIVALSVYIWNVALLTDVVRILKTVRPDVLVVLGGPELLDDARMPLRARPIVQAADVVITGEGEQAFAALVDRVLAPPASPSSPSSLSSSSAGLRVLAASATDDKVIAGGRIEAGTVPWPYDEYSDDDLAHRTVYVEASRGCVFECSYCLSALERRVRAHDVTDFLAQMQRLLDRGLLRFKFVDRTFNLKVSTSTAILDFFLARLRPGLFLHFELVPDQLPDALRERLQRFPPGCVQLEIGVQTLHEPTAQRVSRKNNVDKLRDNLAFLTMQTGCHLHVDLIAGLPGEDLDAFARGYDTLRAMGPQEIQLGVLKRLPGAPIGRDDDVMRYDDAPPYEVLRTDALDFWTLQRMKRTARVHDLVVNAGRFAHTTRLLLDDAPTGAYRALLAFADELYATTTTTHGIALARLARLLFDHLTIARSLAADIVHDALVRDLGRANVPFDVHGQRATTSSSRAPTREALPTRQGRHHRAAQEHDDTPRE